MILAEKQRIMAAVSQFLRPPIKQSAEKIIVGSVGWLASTESLELTPRDELKKRKLARPRAHSGCDPEGGASCGARARFRKPARAVRKLARPATTPVCQELAARGADRLSATMKRGTGPSRGRKAFGKSRDGAPKGERARKRMVAVTRIIRGARRTGRGIGCAHPKRRCGG